MKIFNTRFNPLVAAFAIALATFSTAGSASEDRSAADPSDEVGFQLIRSATIRIEYAGTRFLIDPMLADKDAYPRLKGTYNDHLRFPRTELPVPLSEVMNVDAVVLTHIHPDHWDDVARRRLPKSMPIIVQDEQDAATVRKDGFTDVRVLGDATTFNGTRLIRVGGQHGSDGHMSKLGAVLGTVSGVVFERSGHATTYFAGDTVWRPEVEAAIRKHDPDVIVLNTGYARILGFDGSIIMGKEDLARASAAAPDAVVIGVHMDAVNHAGQTREELTRYIAEQNLDASRIRVPADAESYRF